MNGVVRADDEVCADGSQLLGRREHQLPHLRPVAAVDRRHVLGKRVRVHGHFGMPVPADQLRAFHANGAVAERGALRRARDDADVLRHEGYQPISRLAELLRWSPTFCGLTCIETYACSNR